MRGRASPACTVTAPVRAANPDHCPSACSLLPDRGGLNLGALLLALMVAMGIVWWGQSQGDIGAGGARARKLRSTEVD